MFEIKRDLLERIATSIQDAQLEPKLAGIAFSCSYLCSGTCENTCNATCTRDCASGQGNTGW